MDTLLKWARSVGSVHAFLYHFYKLTIHKMYMPRSKAPSTHPNTFENGYFFPPFLENMYHAENMCRHKNATTMEMWQHLLLNMLLADDVWHRFSFVHM